MLLRNASSQFGIRVTILDIRVKKPSLRIAIGHRFKFALGHIVVLVYAAFYELDFERLGLRLVANG